MQYIIPGLDPTGLPCISKADILQMFVAATPKDKIGFVIFSDNPPDIVTSPEEKFFLWVKTVLTVPNGEVYYYTGIAWKLMFLIIPDKSIVLGKFDPTGANPGDIIQVNNAATAFVYTSIVDAISNGILPVDKLVVAVGTDPNVLTSINGTIAWQPLTSITYPVGSIPANALKKGADDTKEYFLGSMLGVVGYVDLVGSIKDTYLQNRIVKQSNLRFDYDFYAADTGVINAYAVSFTPVCRGYLAGLKVYFKAANTNSGASTLNIDGLGTVAIKTQAGHDLSANTIVAGGIYCVIHDGTNFQMSGSVASAAAPFMLDFLNSVNLGVARANLGLGGSPVSYLLFEHQTGDPGGGNFPNGAVTTVPINTEITDVDNYGSIAGNQITLQPGTYRAKWGVVCYEVGQFQVWLKNVTDNVIMKIGMTGLAQGGDMFTSVGHHRFKLTVPTVLQLEGECTVGNIVGTGFGISIFFQPPPNVFSYIEFEREAN